MGKVDENEGSAGLAPGTLIDGRYKVVRFIGQGGNGLVHEVEHVLTGRRLALKSLHDETAYGRLEQEARATSLMKNGHAVKITDMGTNAGSSPYIVMELLEGQSLRTLLDDTGQLPLELTINIALQVTECLAEAHQHGIVHRDLKPDNVYLCQGTGPGQYDVKVLDFGVVKIAQDGPIPNSSLTRTGSTVGTPFYMSLEQLRNSSAVDQRADIYALGVVLYEALSGRKPFQAETIGDLVYALCSGPPTHLSRLRPDLPTSVCDVIMRALSSSRDLRQPTMIDLAGDLLPFGDATYGQWLRQGDTKRRPSSTPDGASHTPGTAGTPRPAVAAGTPRTPGPGPVGHQTPGAAESPQGSAGGPAHTPSGVKLPAKGPTAPVQAGTTHTPLPSAAPRPALGAPTIPRPDPSPPRPTTASGGHGGDTPHPGDTAPREPWDRRRDEVAVDEDRRSGAERRKGQAPVAEDRRAASAPPPPSDRGGDRDTPTEMYVKGVHGGATAVTVGTAHTPSGGSPVQTMLEAPRPPLDSHPGDRDTPTRAMEAVPAQMLGSGGDTPHPGDNPHHAPDLRSPFPSNPLGDRGIAPGPVGDRPHTPGPFGQPQPGSAQISGPHSAIATGQNQAFPGLRPAWQEKLDRMLVRVGGALERLARSAAHRFRAASPRAQIIIVVAAASLFAAFVVLTIWLLTG